MKQTIHIVAVLAFLSSLAVRAQTSPNPVVTNPTGSQVITQPTGTALNVVGTLAAGQNTNGTAAIDAHDSFAFFGNNSATTGIAINYYGNVGINTGLTSPSNWLSIAGGMNVDANDDATDNNWLNYATNTGISFGMFSGEGIGSARVDGSANQNGIDFYTAYVKRLSITPYGSVGIGTTTPNTWSAANTGVYGTNVQIFGSTGTRLILNSPIGSELHMVIGGAPPNQRNHRLYTTNSGLGLDQPADDYSSSTINMFWQNNGFVGIGTNTPSSALEVNGGISLTRGSSGALTFADGTVQSTALPTLSTGVGASASNYIQMNANNGMPSYLGNVVNGQNDWSLNTYYNGNSWVYGANGPTAAIRMGSGVGEIGFYTTPSGTGGSANSTMDTAGPKMSLSLAGGLSLGNQYVGTDPGAGNLTVVGNIGIGTPTPSARLEVDGDIKLTGALVFPDGSKQSSATSSSALGTVTSGVWNGSPLTATYLPATVVYADTTQTITGQKSFMSNVSIGTTNLAQPTLDVSGYSHFAGSTNPITVVQGAYIGWNALTGGTGETDFVNNPGGGPGGFAFMQTKPDGTNRQTLAYLDQSGDLGVGTATPGANLTVNNQHFVPNGPVLEVSGYIALSTGQGGSMIFPDGTTQSTAWNGTTFGQDYAEEVDVEGLRSSYEPGDLICIDEYQTGTFHKTDQPYSKLVAGVFSTKPGLLARRPASQTRENIPEIPMAMIGIVPTKVTTENGPIRRGDLLVTSSKPGFAMKGTDPARLMGAVIGKAMAPLDGATGIIPVLVAIQ